MPLLCENLGRRGSPNRRGSVRLWEDLLTGASLVVFLILLACVLFGTWLYETGV